VMASSAIDAEGAAVLDDFSRRFFFASTVITGLFLLCLPHRLLISVRLVEAKAPCCVFLGKQFSVNSEYY
jgi:hypothetical protein